MLSLLLTVLGKTIFWQSIFNYCNKVEREFHDESGFDWPCGLQMLFDVMIYCNRYSC